MAATTNWTEAGSMYSITLRSSPWNASRITERTARSFDGPPAVAPARYAARIFAMHPSQAADLLRVSLLMAFACVVDGCAGRTAELASFPEVFLGGGGWIEPLETDGAFFEVVHLPAFLRGSHLTAQGTVGRTHGANVKQYRQKNKSQHTVTAAPRRNRMQRSRKEDFMQTPPVERLQVHWRRR